MIIESIYTNIYEEAKYQTILSGHLNHRKLKDAVDKDNDTGEVKGRIKRRTTTKRWELEM